MGFPPPPDAPPPSEQDAKESLVSFAPTPAGPALCGFSAPSFAFAPSFRVPDPFGSLLDFPPKFDFSVALKCDLSDPIDVPAGGGRSGTLGLDDDPEFGPDG